MTPSLTELAQAWKNNALALGVARTTDEAIETRMSYAVLDKIHAATPVETLIQGGAHGADALAREWAVDRQIQEIVTEYADWERHGKAAGPLRNQRMLDVWHPDVVVAFPGGRGTASMVRLAQRANVPVSTVL
jgi:2-keto-3-deoxy-L-rhamnonate aldolase RhmA